MKKSKYLAAVLAGAMMVTSLPSQLVFAENIDRDSEVKVIEDETQDAETIVESIDVEDTVVLAEADSGTFGENNLLTWTWDGNGTLTISGTDDDWGIEDEETIPWKNYQNSIKKIIIGSGITEIGRYAFSGCGNLTNITLPDGVTSIGSYAFSYCNNLISVTIPDSVTSIGGGVFKGCSSLTSITLPKGMTCIYVDTFYGCSSLTSIIIPEGVTEIYEYAFYGCSGLTSVTIPDSVTTIWWRVFTGCDSLTSVIIPNSVTSIMQETFAGCDSLTSVTIPDSVTSIEYRAFANCSSLKSVHVPATVRWIDLHGFENCTLYGVKGSETEKFAEKNEDVEFVEEIYTMDFTDIQESDWYYDAVKFVSANKIMTGLNETTFGPTDSLARAQFAVMLHRLEGAYEMEYADRFPDVGDGIWYTNAILWAAENGIITGYSNTGMFGPGDVLQRQQLAVMLYRYANYRRYDTTARKDITSYIDYSIVDDYAKEALSWAVGQGIITGKAEGTMLDPTGNASRAETAIMLQRFMTAY